jgi:hypothetical protein
LASAVGRHLLYVGDPHECVEFLGRLVAGIHAEPPGTLGADVVSLVYGDVDDGWRRSVAGWPLGAEQAHPIVRPAFRDGSSCLPCLDDIRLVAACCRALAVFTETYREALALPTTEALEVHLPAGKGLEVRLWLEALEGFEGDLPLPS